MKNANPSVAPRKPFGAAITATSDVSSLRLLDGEAAAAVAANSPWTVWPTTQHGVRADQVGPAQA